MKRKKILSVLLAASMTISMLTGCGGGTDTPGAADNSQSTTDTQDAAAGDAQTDDSSAAAQRQEI